MRIWLPTPVSQRILFRQDFHNLAFVTGSGGSVQGTVSVDRGLDLSGGGYVIFGIHGAASVWQLDEWTVEAEVLVPAVGTQRAIVTCGDPGLGDQFELGIAATGEMYATGSATSTSASAISAGRHTLKWTFWDGHIQFFCDGVKVGFDTWTMPGNHAPRLFVGMASDGASRSWASTIYSLWIYSEAKTADDLVWQTTDTTQDWTLAVDAGKAWSIDWGDGNVDDLVGTGANQNVTHNYAGAGTYTIKFRFEDPTDVTYLNGSGNNITGDIAQLGAFTSLTYLRMNTTSVSGNVGDLSTLTSLTYLRMNTTSVSGNVGDLSTLTSLSILYLYDTSVSGSVGDLSTLTSLTDLRMGDTSVSGGVGDLSTLTSLSVLFLYNTSVSGGVGDLSTLTSLTYLYLYDTSVSYTTAALPTWAGTNIQVQNCGWSQSEVDQFLIDLADGVGANGDLDIAGTNAARSSASDAAKATLLAAGWGVTVNE